MGPMNRGALVGQLRILERINAIFPSITSLPDPSASAVNLKAVFGSMVVGAKRPAKKEEPTPVDPIDCLINPAFAVPTPGQLTRLLHTSLYEKVPRTN